MGDGSLFPPPTPLHFGLCRELPVQLLLRRTCSPLPAPTPTQPATLHAHTCAVNWVASATASQVSDRQPSEQCRARRSIPQCTTVRGCCYFLRVTLPRVAAVGGAVSPTSCSGTVSECLCLLLGVSQELEAASKTSQCLRCINIHDGTFKNPCAR